MQIWDFPWWWKCIYETSWLKIYPTFKVKHQFHLLTLPNDKIVHWSELKAFADNKTNVAEILKFVLGRVENIVGKQKMLITSILSFFP